jgi:hypothetical protein
MALKPLSVRGLHGAGALLVIASVLVSIVGPASSGVAASKPPQPDVLPITATFVHPVTTYTVEVSGGTGTIHYAWANSNSCGSFTGGNRPTATWSHPDSNDPNNPGADFAPGSCPNEPVHPGAITVTVTDENYRCVAGYSGSGPGTSPEGGLCVADARSTTTTSTTTTLRPPPVLIPHIVNYVESPELLYKRVMGECSRENLQIAKNGGLFSYIPYFKDVIKGTAGLKEKDTFVETILEKVGLSKVGLGTAAFKKGFAVISIVGDVSAITFNVGALYQGWQAADPPRSDYQKFATVSSVKISLPASLTAYAPKAVTDAGNALLRNGAQLERVSAALLTTFERVQGAYHAKKARFETRQAALAAKFADRAAVLTAAQPALAVKLVAATRSVGAPFTLPASIATAASAKQTTVAPGVQALLTQLGMTSKAFVLAKTQLLGGVKSSFVFPDFLAPPHAAALAKASAVKLHTFATFLRKIAKG